jgi:hypothetical protein
MAELHGVQGGVWIRNQVSNSQSKALWTPELFLFPTQWCLQSFHRCVPCVPIWNLPEWMGMKVSPSAGCLFLGFCALPHLWCKLVKIYEVLDLGPVFCGRKREINTFMMGFNQWPLVLFHLSSLLKWSLLARLLTCPYSKVCLDKSPVKNELATAIPDTRLNSP